MKSKRLEEELLENGRSEIDKLTVENNALKLEITNLTEKYSEIDENISQNDTTKQKLLDHEEQYNILKSKYAEMETRLKLIDQNDSNNLLDTIQQLQQQVNYLQLSGQQEKLNKLTTALEIMKRQNAELTDKVRQQQQLMQNYEKKSQPSTQNKEDITTLSNEKKNID